MSSSLAEPPAIEGTEVGKYTIALHQHRGPLSDVYLAHPTKGERLVALKINRRLELDEETIDVDKETLERVSKLSHPNLLVPEDIFEHEGKVVEVTPWINGEKLASNPRLTELNAFEIYDMSTQIAGALSTMHESGLIHHDCSLRNILFEPGSPHKFYLFDFNRSSKPYYLEEGVYTPNDVPPEYRRGNTPIDYRFDIYQFGSVLWQVLNKSEVTATDLEASLQMTYLETLVHRCQREVSQRYQNATKLLEVLAECRPRTRRR